MKEVKQIVFTKPYTAEYITVIKTDFNDIAENEVVVKTVYSTVSTGTERANFVGANAVSVFSDAEVKAHILLPKGKICSKLYVNGEDYKFSAVKVSSSNYVDFEVEGKDKLSFEIIF